MPFLDDVTIEYPNNLNSVEWKHTRKGQKPFLLLSKAPPIFPFKKICHDAKGVKYGLPSSHTAKAFADYLSVFSSNISNHQSLLTDLSKYSQVLDLTLRPDKCISVVLDGKRMDCKKSFSPANGFTRTITAPQPKSLVSFLHAHYH